MLASLAGHSILSDKNKNVYILVVNPSKYFINQDVWEIMPIISNFFLNLLNRRFHYRFFFRTGGFSGKKMSMYSIGSLLTEIFINLKPCELPDMTLKYPSKHTHVFPSIKAVTSNWWLLLVFERVITLPPIPLETIRRQFVIKTNFIQLVRPPTSKLSNKELQDKSRLSRGITRSNPLWNNTQYANGASPNAPAYWIKQTLPKYIPLYTSSPL